MRFTLLLARSCEVKGPVRFPHLGTSRNGVKFNAEVRICSIVAFFCLFQVGLLSRNIRIIGELDSTCEVDQKVRVVFGPATLYLLRFVTIRNICLGASRVVR